MKRPRRTPDTRPDMWWPLSMIGAAIAIIAILALLSGYGEHKRRAPAGPAGTEAIKVTSREHTDKPVTYDREPPVGGDHAPVWANCGVYEVPVPPELAVHSMEHGAVWLTYPSALPKDQVTALRDVVISSYVGRERFILMSPMLPTSKVPDLVVSAWGRQLRLTSATDPRLRDFFKAFAGGAQSPEPRFPCTGGEGAPVA